MACWEERSASSRSTDSLPLWRLISRWASSPFVRSRQTITTVAPMLASPMAVALPMPELAPVTMQIFPCICVFSVGIDSVLSSSLRAGAKGDREVPDSKDNVTACRFQRYAGYSLDVMEALKEDGEGNSGFQPCQRGPQAK